MPGGVPGSHGATVSLCLTVWSDVTVTEDSCWMLMSGQAAVYNKAGPGSMFGGCPGLAWPAVQQTEDRTGPDLASPATTGRGGEEV